MRLEEDERAFAYVRTLGRARAWVVLNFLADVVEVPLAGLAKGDSAGLELVLCNYGEASDSDSGVGMDAEGETLTLRGYEARVYVQHIHI
jgi:hypothetical protein